MTEPTPAARQSAASHDAPARPAAPANAHDPRPVNPLGDLQQVLGNFGTLERVAPKMEVGAPDDMHEREADAVARAVVRGAETGWRRHDEGDSLRRAPEDERRERTQPAPGPAPAKAPPVAKAPPTPKAPPVAKAPPAPKAPPTPKAPPAPAESRRREEPVVARKPANAGAIPAVSQAAARTIQSSRGAGQPLAAADRSFYEPRFGRDLGNVRIHDDPAAHQAARDVQARAFTYGQDIYFSAGRYQPGTQAGRELMAHELAHTIQQRPGAKIARAPDPPPGAAAPPTAAPLTSSAQATGQPAQTAAAVGGAAPVVADGEATLLLGPVGVPAFRLEGANADLYAGLMRRSPRYTGSRPQDQRVIWKRHMSSAPGLVGKLGTMIDEWAKVNRGAHGTSDRPPGPYVVKSNASTRYAIGELPDLAGELSIPDWDAAGKTALGYEQRFEVDHILELQLTNFPDNPGGHAIKNFQLLRGTINHSSGPTIEAAIDDALIAWLRTVPAQERNDPDRHLMALPVTGHDPRPNHADAQTAKQHHTLAFPNAMKLPHTHTALAPTDVWSRKDIEAGTHLTTHRGATPVVEITTLAAIGGHGKVAILRGEAGGYARSLTVAPEPEPGERKGFAPYTLVRKNLNVGPDWQTKKLLGSLALEIPEDHPTFVHASALIEVERFPGAQFAGHLRGRPDRTADAAVTQQLRGLNLRKGSPVTVETVDLGPGGFEITGYVETTIPLLYGAHLDFALRGNTVELSKTFRPEDIHPPAPLRIEDSTFTLALNSSGDLSASGRINASIDRLGRGWLEGRGSARDGIAISGGFDATPDLFSPGHVDFTYAHGQISGHGILGIPAGKVRGIKSARLEVSYVDERFQADGQAQFDLPGVREGAVHLTYDREYGLTVEGDLTVGKLPGIRSGSLKVRLSERPGGQGYRLAAHGTAQPDIPGVDAELTVDYDDGAFFARVSLPFERGRLHGQLMAGVTNRPLDEAGHPMLSAPPLPAVAPFGAGSAELKLNDWLRGTAGFRLLENGEVVVSGMLTVTGVPLWQPITPKPIPIIPTKRVKIHVFGPVDVSIGGGLDLSYGIEAGVLSGSVFAEYNPAHEDQTHIVGHAALHSGAFVALDLHGNVGGGLDIGVASITAELVLGAQLRVPATLDIGVDLDWRPDRGIVIDSWIHGQLSPRLKFYVKGQIVLESWIHDHTWGPWDLADKEFGSGLNLGFTLPFKYQDEQLDVGWDRIDVQRPDISPVTAARDFLRELAS